MTLKSASCHIKESRSEECWEREQRDPIRDRERSALKGGLMKRAEFVYLSSSSPSSSFFFIFVVVLKRRLRSVLVKKVQTSRASCEEKKTKCVFKELFSNANMKARAKQNN